MHSDDYKQWNLPPIERPKAGSYKLPDVPFDGLPTYKADYVPKCDSKRSPMKPRSELSLPDLPLDSATNYKSDYVPHPLQTREGCKKDFYFKSQAPFNDLTTFKADYTPKNFCTFLILLMRPMMSFSDFVNVKKFQKLLTAETLINTGVPQLCRPSDTIAGSTDPLSATTTHRVDYVPYQMTPLTRYHPDEYKKPEAPMEKATTYKHDYPVVRFDYSPLFSTLVHTQPGSLLFSYRCANLNPLQYQNVQSVLHRLTEIQSTVRNTNPGTRLIRL